MKYVSEVIDPVVEDLVHDILSEMPPNPVDFAIAWLRKRSGGAAPSGGAATAPKRLSFAGENTHLKSELTKMTGFVEEIGEIVRAEIAAEEADKKSDASSEEEDDDDDELDEEPAPRSNGNIPRQSVSAEAYGAWNKMKMVDLPVFKKTEEQKTRLTSVLSLTFLFSSLEDQELSVILDAVQEKEFVDEQIIKEGDDGDCLYVVEKGSLECQKMIDGKETLVKTCVEGDVFGELALLYNCPRAASVNAVGRCLCWRLDRQTFNQVVKQAHQKRSEMYDDFVQEVALFSTMDQAERSRIVECFKIVRYKKGDVVVKQGEEGNRFYLVEEGTLVARKTRPGEDEQDVLNYKVGDYFGELSLLKNQPRAASVLVTSEKAKLIWMDRRTFTKMLGPVQSILEARAASYT